MLKSNMKRLAPKLASQFMVCISLSLLLFISSCGFHLRGHSSETLNKGNVENIHISGNLQFNELAIALRDQAELAGLSVDAASKNIVTINKVEEDNTRIGGTQGADIEQYRLRLTVQWELNIDGQLLMPSPLSAQQLYDYLPNNQLGNDQERLLILSELREQLAQSILRQTIAIANNPPNCCDQIEESTDLTTP